MKYRVLSSVRSLRTPDGAIVLDLNQGRLFNLNPLASRILAMLEEGLTSEEGILAAMETSFEEVPDTAASDLHEFLRQLCQNRLIAVDLEASRAAVEVTGGQ